jgi:hypothetical protein
VLLVLLHGLPAAQPQWLWFFWLAVAVVVVLDF